MHSPSALQTCPSPQVLPGSTGEFMQLPVALHSSTVQALLSLAHASPASRKPSAGQLALAPVQNSATSQLLPTATPRHSTSGGDRLHVPLLPSRSQASHAPSQALLQHTLSTQWPSVHWLSALQASPLPSARRARPVGTVVSLGTRTVHRALAGAGGRLSRAEVGRAGGRARAPARQRQAGALAPGLRARITGSRARRVTAPAVHARPAEALGVRGARVPGPRRAAHLSPSQ